MSELPIIGQRTCPDCRFYKRSVTFNFCTARQRDADVANADRNCNSWKPVPGVHADPYHPFAWAAFWIGLAAVICTAMIAGVQ